MAGTEKSLRGQVFDKIRSDILNGKYKREAQGAWHITAWYG